MVIRQAEVLQGLKPNVDMIGFIGPTKVVPWLQSLRELPRDEFFRACKVEPFQNRGSVERELIRERDAEQFAEEIEKELKHHVLESQE